MTEAASVSETELNTAIATETVAESETLSDSIGKTGCKASAGVSCAVATATALAVTAIKKKKKDE